MRNKLGLTRKAQSLHVRIIVTMLGVMVLLGLFLMATLAWTKFFYRLDQQNITSFHVKSTEKATEIQEEMSTLLVNLEMTGHSLSLLYQEANHKSGEALSQGDSGQSGDGEPHMIPGDLLLSLLDHNQVEGAFYLVFDGEPLEQGRSYPGIHIRQGDWEVSTSSRSDYLLLAGDSLLATTYHLSLDQNWQEEYTPEQELDYLEKPLEALAFQGGEAVGSLG